MSEQRKKRIREKIGQVFQVPLGDGVFGYGQVVTKTKHTFFDCFDHGEHPSLEEIVNKPALFRIVVDSYVIKDGLWPILGVLPVDPVLQEKRYNFTYDYTDKCYKIWHTIIDQVPASPEEIYNLECLASWGEEHVEQRLRDHFAGRPNFDVESFRNQHNPDFEHDIVKFYAQYGYDFKLDDVDDGK